MPDSTDEIRRRFEQWVESLGDKAANTPIVALAGPGETLTPRKLLEDLRSGNARGQRLLEAWSKLIHNHIFSSRLTVPRTAGGERFAATEFENSLQALARAPVGAASLSSAVEALREAVEQLRQDPGLRTGDPRGDFTYDHPVLAAAVNAARVSLRTAVGTAGDGRELANSEIHRWILVGIRAWLNRKDSAFVTLGGRTPTTTYRIDKPTARIAIVGDFGYRSWAQTKVLDMIRAQHRKRGFDLVVHLGDTYFSGTEGEILTNLLAPLRSLQIPAFTLLGNHDLYGGADGFNAALDILEQPGRYFAIETPHTRIACLDTALASERFLRNDGKLDEGQVRWLRGILDAPDSRPVILLSHHYIVSGWGPPMETLRSQISELVRNRILAWYWGHEHSCALYKRDPHGFYGACVGNGAFLETWSEPKDQTSVQDFAKSKCSCYEPTSSFWPHGFLELELSKEEVRETYHNEGSSPLERSFRAR